MKFPAQMSLVEREKKMEQKWSRGKKVLEQHYVGYGAGRVEAFFMLSDTV